MAEAATTCLERIRDLAEVDLGVGSQMLGQILGRLVECVLRPRGQDQELAGAAGLRARNRRGFLDDYVGIRAAHAERAHPRTARGRPPLPGGEPAVYVEGAI